MAEYRVTTEELTSVADKIRQKGKTSEQLEWPVGYENAVDAISTGVDTSDATAVASEIFQGKTAYVANGKATGTFTIEQEIQNQNNEITAIKEALRNKSVGKPEQTYNKTYTQNGSYPVTPDTGKVISGGTITVNTPVPKQEQVKTVDVAENGTVNITPDAGKVLSKVVANVNVPTGGGGEILTSTVDIDSGQRFTSGYIAYSTVENGKIIQVSESNQGAKKVLIVCNSIVYAESIGGDSPTIRGAWQDIGSFTKGGHAYAVPAVPTEGLYIGL